MLDSYVLSLFSPDHLWLLGVLPVLFFVAQLTFKEVYLSFKCRHIPCPSGRIPFLGHALKLLQGNVWDTFRALSAEHGNFFRMHVLGRVYIVMADPAFARHVLQTKAKNYRKDPGTYKVFDCLLGTGIVTSEGERWHRLRRELAPTFKLEILEEVASAALEITRNLFQTLDAAAESGAAVDMAEIFRKLTLQVISLAVLGVEPAESDREISNLYLPIIDECNDRIWYPYRMYLPTNAWWRHRSLVKQLNDYLVAKINDRWQSMANAKEKNSPKYILDRILSGVDPAQFQKDGIQDLRDGLKTFLFAGHDTTACMLTWTLWEVMKSEQTRQKLYNESKSLFPKDDTRPSYDELQNSLPFTFNVLRETLRLHPPVPVITREVVQPDVVGDVSIPQGAVALICMDGIHKRQDLWPNGDVNEFLPSRFDVLDTPSPQLGLGEGVDPWAFLPFINGPRNCLGQHFSLLEVCD